MFPLLLALGVLFLLAVAAGRLCARLRIPRVTGYLLVGLAGGPSAAALVGLPPLITTEQLASLEPVTEICLGLIVFVIGGSFHFKTIRRFGGRLLAISSLEMGLTAALVLAAGLLVGAPLAVAGFLAVMAITTAPAATQMVVREYESEGPLTDQVLTLIGLDNLTAIIAFAALSHAVITPDAPVLDAVTRVAIPLGLGAVIGAALAVLDQRLITAVERQLVLLATIAAVAGGCRWLDVSPMLASLVAGAVLVNASPCGRRMLKDLSAIDYPLYVIFFITAGANLHLGLLPEMGLIGMAYVLARTAGKYTGCWIGGRITRSEPVIRTWLGPSMLAQAGLAIGLSSDLARSWPESGGQVQTAVLASVVVFEGLGPLLTRLSLVRAGEVTVLSLLSGRAPVGYGEGLHQVIDHFRDALGIHGSKLFRKPGDIMVAHVMRRNVEVVPHQMPFDRILRTFGHSRYDRLPVTDGNDELVGVIQYSDVSEVLFDPALRNLIVARDIVSEEHLLLTPSDSIEKAMGKLRAHPDHTYLLVVADDNPKQLMGVVRHNDLLSAQRKIGTDAA